MPEETPLTVREEHHVTEDVATANAQYPFAEDAFEAAKWHIAKDPECGVPVSGVDAYPQRWVVHFPPVRLANSPGLLVRYYRLKTMVVIDWVHFYPFDDGVAVHPDAYNVN